MQAFSSTRRTELGTGADAQKPPLRCGLWARLTAGVRLRYFTLVELLLDLQIHWRGVRNAVA